jgi:hypothetical protein
MFVLLRWAMRGFAEVLGLVQLGGTGATEEGHFSIYLSYGGVDLRTSMGLTLPRTAMRSDEAIRPLVPARRGPCHDARRLPAADDAP